MGQILLYILLAGTAVVTLARPWVGVIAAYVFVILGPQYIWFWNFQGIRPFLLVAIPTMIGIVLALGRNEIDFSFLKTKINLLFLVLFGCITLSYLFGPYVHGGPGPRFEDPDLSYDRIWKTYVFYFMATLCINDGKKFKYLSYVMIASVIYLVYWANDQYLSGFWRGRMAGPRSIDGGMYIDENVFAMIFVVGLPFLYYAGFSFKNKIIRWGLWLVIPFGWHAIFLTGSRGGLLGLAVSVLLIAWRSPKRWIGLLLIPAMLIAYQWQGGSVLKERAATIENYEEESAGGTRLQAWEAAIKMMIAHPVTGVGLGGMGPAFPVYSTSKPRVAHSAYFQAGAESGFIAFVVYISIVWYALVSLLKNEKQWKKNAITSSVNDNIVYLKYLNNGLFVSLCGFSFCSLFLSLNNFEPFFYIVLLINFLHVYSRHSMLPVNSARDMRQ
jgi:probable O-glycosylation ligase (exosortase A-associated)